MKPMPPPDMPPSIQKPQKSLAEFARARARSASRCRDCSAHGNDGLDRPVEIALRGARRWRGCRRARRSPRISSRMPRACWRACPLGLGAQQVLLGDHLEDRARRPAPCRRAPAPGCPAASARVSADTSSWPRIRWLRQQAAAADAELRDRPRRRATPSISLMPGQTPPESCQPPPEPPSHSPRMARAATRRRSVFVELAGERRGSGRWRACRPRSGRPAGWWRRPGASPWECR